MVNLHLTPSIKQLLTLRNPNPLPSPSVSKLFQVLSKTHQEAVAKKAETGWLVLATCSLLTANRPSTVAQLYRFITSGPDGSRTSSLSHAVNKAALMRESALKSTIFVGVPRVILSLAALNEALDTDVKESLRKESRRDATPDNIDATVVRGKALWDSIYQPHAEKLHDKLGSYHPDFISFILQAYGIVLAPMPGNTRSYTDESGANDFDQGNLSRAMGSVVGIACLRAEERVVPQLTSHVFGLLKSRFTPGQNAEDEWLSSDEGTEWVLRTVDEIVEGITTSSADAQAKL